MKKLSLEQLVEVTEAVVSKNPDYIYKRLSDWCLYVHYDSYFKPKCGCLVGHIFHELGVPFEVLAHNEGNPAGDLVKMLFDAGKDVIDFLDVLQRRQDSGYTWSVALSHAKERVGIED